MFLKMKTAVVAATVAVMALSGCSASNSSSGGEDGRDPERGGSMKVYLSDRAPASLLPGASSAWHFTSPIYGQLLRIDEDGKPYGVIAESMEADDPSTWVLHLRDGVTFTDGTPFDAEAVRYNWDWYTFPESEELASSSFRAVAEQIADMTVVDPLTLRVELAKPDSEFGATVAGSSLTMIGSPTAMKEDITKFGRNPIGAAPFVTEKWVPDGELSLTRNEDYYDSDLPYVDRLDLVSVPDQEQRINLLSTGENAMAFATDAGEAAKYRDAGLSVETMSPVRGDGYLFNSARPPFDDVRMRQAVSQAFDAAELNEAVYGGAREVAEGSIPSTSPYFESDIAQPSFDRETAQALVDEYVSEKGGPVEFSLSVNNDPGAVIAAEWIAQQLNALEDVDVQIEALDYNAWAEATTSGNFDMSWLATTFTLTGIQERFTSDSGSNYGKFSNKELDAVIADAKASEDETTQSEAMGEIQRILAEQVPYELLFTTEVGFAYAGDVGGVEMWGEYAWVPEHLFVLPAK